MRKFRVCAWLKNDLLIPANLESTLDNPRLFDITLQDGELANPKTFEQIILEKKPYILNYMEKPIDKNASDYLKYAPKNSLKILSWSLIEE